MSRFKSTLLRAGLLASLLSFGTGAAFAEAPNADIRNGVQMPPPVDQRMALVIGNANYQTAPKLANPGNDAQSMSQLLNSAGFEVTQATDLTRKDMVRVVQDFTAKVAERGPGAVAIRRFHARRGGVADDRVVRRVDDGQAPPGVADLRERIVAAGVEHDDAHPA